ncbi:MAG: toprim domain-containing protein, partial [Actinomycetota bacterium]
MSPGDDVPVLIKCFAGCEAETVLAAANLTWSDVSANGQPPRTTAKGQPPALPSAEKIAGWHRNLLHNSERLKELRQKKGLSLKTIGNADIGWDGNRYTIPVYEDGSLVDVRRYSFTLQPKMRSFKGAHAALYPDDPIGWFGKAVLCEGEFDALLARQKGIPAVTNTMGAATWKDEWSERFSGLDVDIVMDRDKAGRKGAVKRAKALRGIAHARRVMKLTAPFIDLAEFLLAGNDAQDLWQLRQGTPLY